MENNVIKYLTLKLTNVCNLNCAMCGQKNLPERISNKEIELDIIHRTLEELENLEHVYLFGGEPLLYSRFPQLLDMLSKKNIPIRITTNGTMLSKQADDIVKYGVQNIEISMDSYKREVLKNIRGDDILERILKGIEVLNEKKKKYNTKYPIVNLNCVILPHNIYDLENFCHYVETKMIGVETINFEYPIIIKREQGEAHDTILKEVFAAESTSWKSFYDSAQSYEKNKLNLLYKSVACLQRKKNVSMRQVDTYENFLELFSPDYKLWDRMCECPFAAITILPNGDVTFCTDFPDVILGNVYQDSLKEIWNGDISNKFRMYLQKNRKLPICASCIHRDEKLII